jgi:hypothetical protein
MVCGACAAGVHVLHVLHMSCGVKMCCGVLWLASCIDIGRVDTASTAVVVAVVAAGLVVAADSRCCAWAWMLALLAYP